MAAVQQTPSNYRPPNPDQISQDKSKVTRISRVEQDAMKNLAMQKEPFMRVIKSAWGLAAPVDSAFTLKTLAASFLAKGNEPDCDAANKFMVAWSSAYSSQTLLA
jgi:hypothetical protein